MLLDCTSARMKMPAATSSSTPIATWPTTSSERMRVPSRVRPRVRVLAIDRGAARDTRNAGSRPNSSALATLVASAKPITPASIGTSISSGNGAGRSTSMSARVSAHAIETPRMPAAIASTPFSARFCITTRERLAPSA